MNTQYIHGTKPVEQNRLDRLNQWINERCLAAMALKAGDRVVDFGSGLGNLTEEIAQLVGPRGHVVGIEQSDEQLVVARARAAIGNAAAIDYRSGSVEEPPLSSEEWGSFDVAHTRFVLEHVKRPLLVVQNMVRSVRPGGRVILTDDDHPLLRHWPACPGFDAVWTAYQRAFELNGNDAEVGARLVQLLHAAGASPVRNDWIFFGSCSGSPDWDCAVENLIGVVQSARGAMIEHELIAGEALDAAFDSLRTWQRRPDAALWYAISWAEGLRRA